MFLKSAVHGAITLSSLVEECWPSGLVMFLREGEVTTALQLSVIWHHDSERVQLFMMRIIIMILVNNIVLDDICCIVLWHELFCCYQWFILFHEILHLCARVLMCVHYLSPLIYAMLWIEIHNQFIIVVTAETDLKSCAGRTISTNLN